MSFEIHNNVCEICGQKALLGILDNYDHESSNNQTRSRIRYSCHDHYFQVYKKIKEEEEKNKK